ncbi:hypothetical protein MAHJHV63_16410 [Mycobacterium avium subsp. hominissuis]
MRSEHPLGEGGQFTPEGLLVFVESVVHVKLLNELLKWAQVVSVRLIAADVAFVMGAGELRFTPGSRCFD